VGVALAVHAEEADEHRHARRDGHDGEPVDQRLAHLEERRQGVAAGRPAGREQDDTGHGHRLHDRRLDHRAEQPAPLHRAHREDRATAVADIEHRCQTALELHIDECAEYRQAEAEQDSAPPGQPPLAANEGTLVPGHGAIIYIRIACPIANRGHKTTP
jgi:hypothetical protein